MKPELKPPLKWYGGKQYLASKLVHLIPPHHTYVEVFGGAAALLFAKPPELSQIEVLNDIDSGLINFYRVLRDPAKFFEFQRKVNLTPFSREEFYSFRENWHEAQDDVERAYQWYIVARMSFSGHFGHSWSFCVTESRWGISQAVAGYLSAIDRLPDIHERIRTVQIEHRDFRDLIRVYDTPDTFFYLDPPYVHSARRWGKYEHELTDEDHRELVSLVLSVKGKVLLSGYDNELYRPLEENGWVRIDWLSVCYAIGRTRTVTAKTNWNESQKRTETVWMNYRPPSVAGSLFSE